MICPSVKAFCSLNENVPSPFTAGLDPAARARTVPIGDWTWICEPHPAGGIMPLPLISTVPGFTALVMTGATGAAGHVLAGTIGAAAGVCVAAGGAAG